MFFSHPCILDPKRVNVGGDVTAGSSFYITVGPPESTESKPEDGAKALVHLQDPDNGMTLFEAQWDAQQIAFVADVFVGVVGGNVVWATLDVRPLTLSLFLIT